MNPATDDPRPVLRVIRGDATPEEVAAVLAVLAARAQPASASAREQPTTSIWAAHGFAHRQIRATFSPSSHGWRTSFWPR